MKDALNTFMYCAATKDPQNNLVVLCLMHVNGNSEKDKDWRWFLKKFLANFSDCRIGIADDRGVDVVANWDDENVFPFPMARCMVHIVKNAKVNTEEFREKAFILARSTTTNSYINALEELRKINARGANFVDGIKRQFASNLFLNRNIPRYDMCVTYKYRYGIVTSNAAEQTNNVLLFARQKGPLDYWENASNWTQGKFAERHRAIIDTEMETIPEICPYAIAESFKNLQKFMQKWKMMNYWAIDGQHFEYGVEATLTRVDAFDRQDNEQYHTMTLKLVLGKTLMSEKVKCSCRHADEWGWPCLHAMLCLDEISKKAPPRFQKDYNPNSKYWYDQEYHWTTYKACYAKLLPSPILPNDLKKQNLFPGKMKEKEVGARKRKRIERRNIQQRKCSRCTRLGHNARSCPQPDVRVLMKSSKALAQHIKDSLKK